MKWKWESYIHTSWSQASKTLIGLKQTLICSKPMLSVLSVVIDKRLVDVVMWWSLSLVCGHGDNSAMMKMMEILISLLIITCRLQESWEHGNMRASEQTAVSTMEINATFIYHSWVNKCPNTFLEIINCKQMFPW